MSEPVATKTDLKELCDDLKSFTAEMRCFVSEMKVCKTEDRKDIEYIKTAIEKYEASQAAMWKIVNSLKIKIAVAYAIPIIIIGAFEIWSKIKTIP